MREFILCFDPPITIDNWGRVAETLNEKLMFWSNNQKIIDYSPFLREGTKVVGMLAYNRWPHEENPVLTWDSECKVDPQDTIFGKLPILDGWQWVEENSVDYDETSGLFDSLNEGVEERTPRVGDYLLCHTKLVMDYGGVEAIVGNIYPIIDMNPGIIVIKNKSGDPHSFELRGEGSYKRWFTHIPQENYDSVSNIEFWDPI